MKKTILISSLVLASGLSSVAFAKKKRGEEGRASACLAIGGFYVYAGNGNAGVCHDIGDDSNVFTAGSGGSSGGSGGGKGGKK